MFIAYQTSSAVFNLQNDYSAILQTQYEPLDEKCTYEVFIIKEYNTETAVKILEGHCENPYEKKLKESVCNALRNEKRYIRIFNEYRKNNSVATQ